jgi:Flp pilus assembly secretin CpaC
MTRLPQRLLPLLTLVLLSFAAQKTTAAQPPNTVQTANPLASVTDNKVIVTDNKVMTSDLAMIDPNILKRPVLSFSMSLIEGDPHDLDKLGKTDAELRVNFARLAKQKKIRLVIRPNLSALEGVVASTFIGDSFKYISGITQTNNGTEVITATANVGIGVTLTGTCQADGKIMVLIHPEVSSITGTNKTKEGQIHPVINTTSTDVLAKLTPNEIFVLRHLKAKPEVGKAKKAKPEKEMVLLLTVKVEPMAGAAEPAR